MKKILLLLVAIGGSFISQAQVVVAGVSPANIVGGYDFAVQTHPGWPGMSDNGTWSLATDFTVPGTFIQGTLQLTDDGTPGLNAQGNPLSASGCSPLTAGSLTGKIAVVFRYDGVDDNPSTTTPDGPDYCGFADKAYNCQQAGADAVIVISRDDNVGAIAMTGGQTSQPPVVGLNVTIPVVMIGLTDGEAIVAEMANGPVVMFIGNKIGAFQNDIGMEANAWSAPLIGKSGGLPSQLVQNPGEYTMDLGARIYNYGVNAQSNITLAADITGPSGSVYSQSVTIPNSISSGDSVDVAPGGTFTLPAYSNTTFPAGTYTITYTASIASDDYTADNTYSSTWIVQDSVFSGVELDPVTNFPLTAGGSRPSPDITSSFMGCVQIKDPNASRLAVTGVYFSASTNESDNVPLEGEEMQVHLYTWDDAFTDLNDPIWNTLANAWTVSEVAYGSYIYPSDLQGEMVFGVFDDAYVLSDDQRYLACVETVNPKIFLGISNTNLSWNVDNYLEAISPASVDGDWYVSGFGADSPIAVAAGVVNAAEAGIKESASIEGMAYPNPANDIVTISLKSEGIAKLKVTDVAGKVVINSNYTLVNGKAQVNISGIDAGVYVFNVTLEDGKTSQFNVVKK